MAKIAEVLLRLCLSVGQKNRAGNYAVESNCHEGLVHLDTSTKARENFEYVQISEEILHSGMPKPLHTR